MNAFKHKVAILKADDLGRGITSENWWRLLEALRARGLPLSAGVVGADLERRISVEIDRLRLFSRSLEVEFWNHSYTHRDLAKLSATDQKQDIVKAQQVCLELLGAKPTIFGAPFNSYTETTVSIVEEIEEFEAIYFAKSSTRLFNVNVANLLPPEVVGNYRRNPDYSEFLNRYSRRRHLDLAVLQFHPAAWNEAGLHDMLRIVDHLMQENWQFLSLSDYIRLSNVRNTTARDQSEAEAAVGPIEISRRSDLVWIDERITALFDGELSREKAPGPEFTSFYFNRFKRGTADIAATMSRLGFGGAKGTSREGGKARGLEVGFGAGNLLLPYIAQSSAHSADGLDHNAYIVDLTSRNIEALGIGDRLHVVHADSAKLPFPEDKYDHVWSHNALNYMDVEATLLEVARVAKHGAKVYFGVQNEWFFLKGCLGGLLEGNLDSAARRIDQIAYKYLSKYGLVGGRAYSTFWFEGELERLCELTGLVPVWIDAPLLERADSFMGHSLFTGLVMTKRTADEALLLVSDGTTGKGKEALLERLFCVGARRLLLRAAKLAQYTGGDARVDRQIVSSLVWERRRGLAPEGFAEVEQTQKDFSATLSAYLGRDYRGASELHKKAAAKMDTADDVWLGVGLAYAAEAYDEAKALFLTVAPNVSDWDELSWMLNLSLTMRTATIGEAKGQFAKYLKHRYSATYGAEATNEEVVDVLSDTPFRSLSESDAAKLSIVKALRALA